MREGFLHYRYFVNRTRGIPSHLVRDRDEIVSSAVSGMLNGGFLGYYTSGPWAIIAGSITYGVLASSAQYVYSIARKMRQNYALERLKNPNGVTMFGPDGNNQLLIVRMVFESIQEPSIRSRYESSIVFRAIKATRRSSANVV
jgi:hypothetical protein